MDNTFTVFSDSGLENVMGFVEFVDMVNEKHAQMEGICDDVTVTAQMVVKDLGGVLKKPVEEVPIKQTLITHTQTYEISTRVSADVDSKGMVKPSARVAITRKLENGEDINELIHADISRGVEEVTEAINEVLKRGGQ